MPTKATTESQSESVEPDVSQPEVDEPAVNEEVAEEPTEQPTASAKPPFHKRRWVVMSIGGLLVLAVVGGLLWRSRRMGYSKQFVIEKWHVLSSQSEDLAALTKNEAETTKTGDLNKQIRTLDGAIKDQKVSLALIPTFLNDTHSLSTYKNELDKLGAYSTQLANMSDSPSAISADDVTKAKDLASSAKTASEDTKQKLSYLGESLNDKLFDLPAYLESLKQKLVDAQEKTAKETSDKARQAQQDALDKQLVETGVTAFMDGYVSGDAAKMKRYMTDAYIKEYDFNQLGSAQRQYVYPASYRLVNTTKGTGTYQVQVNILNKYRNTADSASDQYTGTVTYTLVYTTSLGRWQINLEKQGS